MKKTRKKPIFQKIGFLLAAFFALLVPMAYSNGGCVKIADDVFVQLTSAPVAPRVGSQTSYLFSFANRQGLISREINGTLRITKNGETVFSNAFKTSDGILAQKYNYQSPGMYEIFFDFSVGGKNYKPEDFLVEAVDWKTMSNGKNYFADKIIFLLAGIVIGAISIKFISKRASSKK